MAEAVELRMDDGEMNAMRLECEEAVQLCEGQESSAEVESPECD